MDERFQIDKSLSTNYYTNGDHTEDFNSSVVAQKNQCYDDEVSKRFFYYEKLKLKINVFMLSKKKEEGKELILYNYGKMKSEFNYFVDIKNLLDKLNMIDE